MSSRPGHKIDVVKLGWTTELCGLDIQEDTVKHSLTPGRHGQVWLKTTGDMVKHSLTKGTSMLRHGWTHGRHDQRAWLDGFLLDTG